jgi:hypothetical protein
MLKRRVPKMQDNEEKEGWSITRVFALITVEESDVRRMKLGYVSSIIK